MRTTAALLTVAMFAVFTGEAHPDVFQYQAFLDGPSESPPNASPGTGFATLTYDDVAHTMHIDVSWSDLFGTTTIAHIHAPTLVPFTSTASPATQVPSFVGFPVGVTSGNYDNTFDLTLAASWNAGYITANGGTPAGAEAAFAQHLAEGRAYLNIHTSAFQGGEIRGFFIIPEPATLVPAAIGTIVLAGYRWRRRATIRASS